MKKTEFQQINLGRGSVRIYEKGAQRLHYYATNDPIDDQVIIIEGKDGVVSIEAPLFRENVNELNAYVRSLGKETTILAANHPSPLDYLPEAKMLTTKRARLSLISGSQIALYNGFRNTFGDVIQKETRDDYQLIEEGQNIIGGMAFNLLPNNDGFDIEVSGLNSVYIHMLGHDTHSIALGIEGTKGMIAELREFLKKGYDLYLTSHYEAEDGKDVEEKVSYLESLVEIAGESDNRDSFKNRVMERFPNYHGVNYLNISANAFFED